MGSFIETLERLEYLDRLIRLKATGSPKELTGKLKLSLSHLYNLLKLLKGFGAPVCFDVSRNSYCYYKVFTLNISLNNYLTQN